MTCKETHGWHYWSSVINGLPLLSPWTRGWWLHHSCTSSGNDILTLDFCHAFQLKAWGLSFIVFSLIFGIKKFSWHSAKVLKARRTLKFGASTLSQIITSVLCTCASICDIVVVNALFSFFLMRQKKSFYFSEDPGWCLNRAHYHPSVHTGLMATPSAMATGSSAVITQRGLSLRACCVSYLTNIPVCMYIHPVSLMWINIHGDSTRGCCGYFQAAVPLSIC